MKMLEMVSRRMVCMGSLSGCARSKCFSAHYLSFPICASADLHIAFLQIFEPSG